MVCYDFFVLYKHKNIITAKRIVNSRLKLNDENPIAIHIESRLNYKTIITVIDELPYQFQARNWKREMVMKPRSSSNINYTIKPFTRGEYIYDNIRIEYSGPLQLVKKQIIFKQRQITKVYPNIFEFNQYQLKALGSEQHDLGAKKIRRLGNSTAFEQIKEYVTGDDYRTINWKATARKTSLMVNTFAEEKSQLIYNIIDTGRLMKMPFENMTLLDYAVNATVMISKTALAKQDRVGLITFSNTMDSILAADKKPHQLKIIQEHLYKIETQFLEPDYELLYTTIRNKIKNRSLLILYTNFESIEGLHRVIPALKHIARYHLLLVVLFENTTIHSILDNKPKNIEDIYVKTIAEKYVFEKKQMVSVLRQNGILSILTPPQKLTVSIINKYLELKNKAWI